MYNVVTGRTASDVIDKHLIAIKLSALFSKSDGTWDPHSMTKLALNEPAMMWTELNRMQTVKFHF